MNSLIQLAAEKPRIVLSLLAMLLFAGFNAFVSMPREAMPTVPVPLVLTNVVLEGVSPADSERLLVRPIEEQYQSLEGVKEMRATAFQGGATVIVEFDASIDTDKALNDIRAAIDRVRPTLPDQIREPVVRELDFSQRPVLNVSLAADLPERTLLKLAREVRDRVVALPQVLNAEISGAREEQVEIIIDPLKAENYGLTQDDLLRAVSRSNRLVAAGALETERGKFAVTVPGLFETLEDIYSLPIKSTLNATVKLKDVAEIRRTFKDRATYVRVNGKPAVSVEVTRRAEANIIDLNAKVKALVAEMQKTWPAQVTASYPVDDSKSIVERVSNLVNGVIASVFIVMAVCVAILGIRNGLIVGIAIPGSFLTGILAMALYGVTLNVMALFGLILAVGMLVDGAIIVVDAADKNMADGMTPTEAYVKAAQRMAWPITTTTLTTIAAFVPLMLWPGLTGKFFSYLPLSVVCVLTASLVMALYFIPAIGILFSRRPGLNAAPATDEALSAERRAAIEADIHAVAQKDRGAFERLAERFAPRLKKYFQDQGASAPRAEALTGEVMARVWREADDTPARTSPVAWLFRLVSSAWRTEQNKPARPEPDPADPAYVKLGVVSAQATIAPPVQAKSDLEALTSAEYANDALTKAYARVLNASLNHAGKVLAGTVIMLFVVVFAFIKSGTGIVFFPPQEPDRAVVKIFARGNLSIEEQDVIIKDIDARVRGVEGLEFVYARSGRPAGSGEAPADLVGELSIRFQAWDTRRPADEIIADVQARLADLPGIETAVEKIGTGPPRGGPAIQMEITAADPAALPEAVAKIRAQMDKIGGFVNVDDSRPLPNIEWQLRVDRDEAARYGADITLIGQSVQLVTKGLKLGAYRPDDSTEEIDIVARYPTDQRSIRALDDVRVETARGLVPISNFVERVPEQQAGEIARIDTRRVMTVKADAAPGKFAGALVGRLKGWLAQGELGPGVTVRFKGEQADSEESGSFLGKALLLALFLIAVIMLIEFDSFYYVFLVLSAAVLSTIGVFLGLMIFNQPFSVVMTGIGVVTLAGVVVSNNIVLVDSFQDNLRRSFTRKQAVLYTGIERFRPVLLTSGTAIVGLLPTALSVDIDFIHRDVIIGSPSGQWWAYLSQAIIYGLVFAKGLTLIVTPCALMVRENMRVWWHGVLARIMNKQSLAPPLAAEKTPSAVPEAAE
ncbi:MAG: efflux RND transporter permease subunit [Rhodospirillaceae bacterium]|nr:efflux RND transporter permease subunit [Rhodospirillaceae bacterium]